jgi:hypothetical protein
MTTVWLDAAGGLGHHPVMTVLASLALVTLVWAMHVVRLRRREHDLLLLVEERTRLWQDEVAAHADLRARLGVSPGATSPTAVPGPAGAEAATDPAARVLVVDESSERRDTVAGLLRRLGTHPAFADSAWAASVASTEADARGTPFDLVLVGSATLQVGTRSVQIPDPLDVASLSRLLPAGAAGSHGSAAASLQGKT